MTDSVEEVSDERLEALRLEFWRQSSARGIAIFNALTELRDRRSIANTAGETVNGNWFALSGDARLGVCATDACGGQPAYRLEAGGVGSNYCSGCAERIKAIPALTSPQAGPEDVTGGQVLNVAHRIQSILAEKLTVDEGEIVGVGPASYKIARLFKPAPALTSPQADHFADAGNMVETPPTGAVPEGPVEDLAGPAARRLFQYTRTFNAIAAATSQNATGIGISVRAFIKAFGPIDLDIASELYLHPAPEHNDAREVTPEMLAARDFIADVTARADSLGIGMAKYPTAEIKLLLAALKKAGA